MIIPTVAKQIQQKMLLEDSGQDELIEEYTRDGMPVRSVTMPSLLSSRSLSAEPEEGSARIPEEPSSPCPPMRAGPHIGTGNSGSNDLEMHEGVSASPLPLSSKQPSDLPLAISLPAQHTEAWQQPGLASPRIAKQTMGLARQAKQASGEAEVRQQKEDQHRGGCKCVIS